MSHSASPWSDDLGEQHAMAAALADAGAKADGAVGVLQARDLADQRQAVGRIGDRAVDLPSDADLGECRQPFENGIHVVEQAIHVVRAERHGEIGVDAVHAPGLAALLVDADQERIPFLARIEVIAGITDDGHAPAARPLSISVRRLMLSVMKY